MKRCLFGLAVIVGVALAGRVAQGADPDQQWREAVRIVVTTNGLAVKTDTNATSVASQYTPAFKGQFLIGLAGVGTNAIWVAKGLTTNDWVQIEP